MNKVPIAHSGVRKSLSLVLGDKTFIVPIAHSGVRKSLNNKDFALRIGSSYCAFWSKEKFIKLRHILEICVPIAHSGVRKSLERKEKQKIQLVPIAHSGVRKSLIRWSKVVIDHVPIAHSGVRKSLEIR